MAAEAVEVVRGDEASWVDPCRRVRSWTSSLPIGRIPFNADRTPTVNSHRQLNVFMSIKSFKSYELMIFIALTAIAFSFNNMYLSVEFTLVLILALSPVFLAATRHIKNASAPDNREIGKPKQNRILFLVSLYFCFLMSILSACLVADIAWSLALEKLPIDEFFSLEDILYGLDLIDRITKSIMIMTNLMISWFMIRRFSSVSPGQCLQKLLGALLGTEKIVR